MRLFIGIELGDPVLAAVERTLGRVLPLSPDSKWSSREKSHLTLAFLGAVEESRVKPLEEAVRTVERHAPFTLRFEDGGTFGGKARPRVLWVDVKGELDALAAVQATVASAVRSLGIELEDRPYVAHLTLARARHPRGDAGLALAAEKLHGKVLGETRVTSVALFQSHTSNKGSVYEVLHRWPLSQ